MIGKLKLDTGLDPALKFGADPRVYCFSFSVKNFRKELSSRFFPALVGVLFHKTPIVKKPPLYVCKII